MNEMQVLANETIQEILKHQREQMKHYRILALSCLASLITIILILIGSVFYFLNTYDITPESTTTYEQSADGEGGNIINGDQFNDNSHKFS